MDPIGEYTVYALYRSSRGRESTHHRWHHKFRARFSVLLHLPRSDLRKTSGPWRRVQPFYRVSGETLFCVPLSSRSAVDAPRSTRGLKARDRTSREAAASLKSSLSHPRNLSLRYPKLKSVPSPPFIISPSIDLTHRITAVEWGSDRGTPTINDKAGSFLKLAGDASVPGGKMAQSLRSMGSAALGFSMVAQGALDMYW